MTKGPGEEVSLISGIPCLDLEADPPALLIPSDSGLLKDGWMLLLLLTKFMSGEPLP